MKVLKFGGSSVASADRIRDVAAIIIKSAAREKTIVVVSAFQGVTNALLAAASTAASGNRDFLMMHEELAVRHRTVASELLGAGSADVLDHLGRLLADLHDVLQGMYLLRHSPAQALDLTASFGERLSAFIVSAFLRQQHPSVFVDTREMVVTDDQFTRAGVLFDQTNEKIRASFATLRKSSPANVIPVVTGFIGATEDGRTTTIGRNGSDYSAAIIGAALRASSVEIWTDVDGILSADPHIVPSAFVLPSMTYEEAMELSYFGAKVLHAATIAPAVAEKIPIVIKNTLNPSAPGTIISDRRDAWEGVAKGISTVDGMTLLTLRGMSMVGVPGTAERLFRSLASHSVNVILISQASSEHTICFAVSTSDVPRARKAIAGEFRYELQNRLTSLDEKPAQTIVAIVGEGMKGTPGVAGKVFDSLGRNNVNLSAIAQGASERNISFVIDSAQKVRALNVIHQSFFEKKKTLSLAVIGVGNIGAALLQQLEGQRKTLLQKGFDVRVCAIADSKRYVASADGIDLGSWRTQLSHGDKLSGPEALAGIIASMQLADVALVDCTASSAVVDAYPDFVRANAHIITPNKKANVLAWKRYAEFSNLLSERRKYFLYEANVGAGLPIISTLQDLVASGDSIQKIEGILSGTLSYLLNTYDGSGSFSELVREAHAVGFTEPDPREDLSGNDVARKLLILARQMGIRMEMKDIEVETLVPKKLRGGDFEKSFFDRYSIMDKAMAQRYATALAKGKVLRYVGVLEGGKARAGIAEFPRSHPLANTRGSDNIIAFTTERYARTPLVVQGPGAGAEVTAMGVFSDILKLLHYLPH